MRKTMLLCLLVIQQIACSAQRISYTYDDAGNRILKKVTITAKLMSVSTSQDDEDEETEEAVASATIIETASHKDSELRIINDKESILLQLPKDVSSHILLTTTDGKPVLSKSIEDDKYMINLSNFQRGVYILTVKTDKQITNWKINKR